MIDIVEALPAAILWSILGIAAVALALAARAFRLSGQRRALELQRGVLLDDIGLLSRALLPPVPELDGLAVSAAYRPADGPAAGGDFYDVFTLDDDRVGVLLGDVSGHGRDSVTLAALARYTLRTLLVAGHGPGAALAEADRLLAREMRPRFATVIAAVYDRRTTRLTYAKAGHAPPIVVGTPHDSEAETPALPDRRRARQRVAGVPRRPRRRRRPSASSRTASRRPAATASALAARRSSDSSPRRSGRMPPACWTTSARSPTRSATTPPRSSSPAPRRYCPPRGRRHAGAERRGSPGAATPPASGWRR